MRGMKFWKETRRRADYLISRSGGTRSATIWRNQLINGFKNDQNLVHQPSLCPPRHFVTASAPNPERA